MNENEQYELTFGDKAVGVTFNPSQNLEVSEIKAYYAGIIDFIHNRYENYGDDEMKKRLYDMALEDAMRAQMSAVKLITWGLPRE